MRASCLCGEVTLTLPSRPDAITFCDCSVCRKLGAVWSYFARGAVGIEGETRMFMRTDMDNPVVELNACPRCSATTHWNASPASGHDRMGVNMRLFDPEQCAGMEAWVTDGRGWDRQSTPDLRRPLGIVGEDVLIA